MPPLPFRMRAALPDKTCKSSARAAADACGQVGTVTQQKTIDDHTDERAEQQHQADSPERERHDQHERKSDASHEA